MGASPEPREVPAQQTDDWIDRKIGPYTVVRKLANGVEAPTYEAFQREPVERTVAIQLFKVLSVHGDMRRSIHHQPRAALSVIDHCIASHPGYSAFQQTKDVLIRDFGRLLSKFQN